MEANMDETMGDLASLKRPALQKLCKKFGIKANGKNVDMIKALEELRDSASLVVYNIESMPHGQPSQPEANLAFPSVPSPDVAEVNPSTRKGKKRGRGGRKKKDAPRKLSNQNSLSPNASSAGDTPLSLSGVSNKPCAWLTTSTDSPNLSESQLSYHQSVQNSPPRGRKRRCSGSANFSPDIPTPVAKHARYELPHQDVVNDPLSMKQPSEASISPAQISTSPPQTPFSPPQAPISPPQAPISPPQVHISPQASISPSRVPISPPQAPVSPPQAPISPPQVSISPQAPICPPQAPISPVRASTSRAPTSHDQAPFSPPLTSEDLQSNSKRKRKSTYTLDESGCGELSAMKEEDGEPPSKRVRRATFSVSPKITNKNENEVNSTNENVSAKVEDHSTKALSGIVDVHSEIMDLLDKRVEKIQADPNYKPVFSASESSSKTPLKPSTAIVKKFDSAHKKQFSRMQSIVSYQSDKDRRHAAIKKGNVPYTGNIPRPTDKRTSKIPKAPTAASRPKSIASFKPSTLSVKQASFNFASSEVKAATKKATKPETKSMVTSACENRVRRSAVASKTPGKKGGPGVITKTPSNVFTFAATASCTSTKKAKPNCDVNKLLKKKPTYKPHSGKLPDFKISRF